MMALRWLLIAVLFLWWLPAIALSWCGFAWMAARTACLRRRVQRLRLRRGAP